MRIALALSHRAKGASGGRRALRPAFAARLSSRAGGAWADHAGPPGVGLLTPLAVPASRRSQPTGGPATGSRVASLISLAAPSSRDRPNRQLQAEAGAPRAACVGVSGLKEKQVWSWLNDLGHRSGNSSIGDRCAQHLVR